jgi:hypothetical protein
MMRMTNETSEYPNGLPGFLENSVSKPFYHTDLGKTLEGITLKPTPEEGNGILAKVFADKTKTLKAGVKALLQEIKLRESLDSHFLKKIDEEICRQHTEIMNLENVRVQYASPDLSKEIAKKRLQFENNVLELEKEKRAEYLECWRDLMFLKKYLLASLKDYWNLVKRRELLGGNTKRSGC